MFNVSQLYSIPQCLRAISMQKKKQILHSLITFPTEYQRKNINIFNEKLTNGLFQLQYDVADFTFSLKYRQRKVDLNASEKSLVFVTKRPREFHLCAQLSYTKISYLHKNTHLQKDAAFLHFRLKKSQKIRYFRETETYKN